MQSRRLILDQARRLVEPLCGLPPEPDDLRVVADSLRAFAVAPIWQDAPYREAVTGEDLLYELAVSSGSRPSLYLVSDGATVASPPHCHGTWAVIVGIRGNELNHLYSPQAADGKTVVRTAEIEVGPGQALILGSGDIHSTEVRGVGATFHLHLYGQALNELPSFESRCYAVAAP